MQHFNETFARLSKRFNDFNLDAWAHKCLNWQLFKLFLQLGKSTNDFSKSNWEPYVHACVCMLWCGIWFHSTKNVPSTYSFDEADVGHSAKRHAAPGVFRRHLYPNFPIKKDLAFVPWYWGSRWHLSMFWILCPEIVMFIPCIVIFFKNSKVYTTYAICILSSNASLVRNQSLWVGVEFLSIHACPVLCSLSRSRHWA